MQVGKQRKSYRGLLQGVIQLWLQDNAVHSWQSEDHPFIKKIIPNNTCAQPDIALPGTRSCVAA